MIIRPLDDSNILPVVADEPEIYQLQEPFVSLPPRIVKYFPAATNGEDASSLNINFLGGGVAGVNSIGTLYCENIATLDDLFNFGYRIKIVETNDILSRVNRTTYTDELSTVVIEQLSYSEGWRLSRDSNYYYNNDFTPRGLFSGTQNLSVIYTNE